MTSSNTGAAMNGSFLEPLSNPSGSKVDVIFVDGFGGGSPGAKTSSTAVWPPDLLNQTGKIARVFRFRHNATLDDFYPEPNHKGTSIDYHSAKLLQGLGSIAQTGDRSIILVARDLGGLVCANALSQQDANTTVVNNVRGIVFFETPFEGKTAVRWAKAATDLPALRGLKMPSNLKERSWKLVNVNKEFVDFLESRKRLTRTQYFYGMYAPSTPLTDDDLVEVTDGNWREISFHLAQWIKEFGTKSAKREENRPSSITVGETYYQKELSHISGVVTGGVVTTRENGIRITVTTNNYYGQEYQPGNQSSSLEPGQKRRQ